MHNNAIGPEVCGKPKNNSNDFYRSPYVDASNKPLPNPPPCWAYDPSVAGRFKLYKASMDELLTPPEKRPRKVMLLTEPIIIEAGPRSCGPLAQKEDSVRDRIS